MNVRLYVLDPPADQPEMPEELRTIAKDEKTKDWYLNAWMLGLSKKQELRAIADGRALFDVAGDQWSLFSVNYILASSLLDEERKEVLRDFLEKLED